MFLNDLYKIDSLLATSETIAAEIKLNSSHEIFAGHFPNSPVTPGVVQLQIVKEILQEYFQKNLTLKNLKTCKFLQIINPLETPEITINIKFIENTFLDVVASGNHGENVYFKAQISYSY